MLRSETVDIWGNQKYVVASLLDGGAAASSGGVQIVSGPPPPPPPAAHLFQDGATHFRSGLSVLKLTSEQSVCVKIHIGAVCLF